MSDLVERVEKAVMEIWVCGIEIDGVRMLCCDKRAKGRLGYWKPEDCHCRNSARAAKAILLEEAAKVAEAEKMEGIPPPTLSLEQITAIEAATKMTGKSIAKKIRKLREE